jgi:hypothetical protein
VSTAFNDVKPWPTAKAPPEAVGSQPGHNRPPLDIEARAAFDETIDQKEGFRTRAASARRRLSAFGRKRIAPPRKRRSAA